MGRFGWGLYFSEIVTFSNSAKADFSMPFFNSIKITLSLD
jgi:hypothetical protein